MNTSTLGCARVGEASETTEASASNDHVTPADETPFHLLVFTSTCRARVRNGLSVSCAVKMIDGSMKTGIPKPPAVVVPSDMARYSSNDSTARDSSAVRIG